MEQFIHAAFVFGLLVFDRCFVSVNDCLGYFQNPCVVIAVEWIIHSHVTYCMVFPTTQSAIFLPMSSFNVTVSTPFTHSHSLSLILFHENNRYPHRTTTVIQLQTSPSWLCTLNSAYLYLHTYNFLLPLSNPSSQNFNIVSFWKQGSCFFSKKQWLVSVKSFSKHQMTLSYWSFIYYVFYISDVNHFSYFLISCPLIHKWLEYIIKECYL